MEEPHRYMLKSSARCFASIISPHITSLSPLQSSAVFASLLITNPVPGQPSHSAVAQAASQHLFLATPCAHILSPLGLYASKLLIFPLYHSLLTACTPRPDTFSLPTSLIYQGPTLCLISFHWIYILPGWFHIRPCSIWHIPISHTLGILTSLHIHQIQKQRNRSTANPQTHSANNLLSEACRGNKFGTLVPVPFCAHPKLEWSGEREESDCEKQASSCMLTKCALFHMCNYTLISQFFI
jgi:hypothetical protein